MSNLKLMAATRTIETTMPFLTYRLLICLGAAFGFLLATLAGAGTLVGFGSLARNALSLGPFGALIGFLLFGFLMYKLRPYWLSVIKTPQLALAADQAKGTELPGGKALVDYAKSRHKARFPSTTDLFDLDEKIRAALTAIAERQPLACSHLTQPLLRKGLAWVGQSLSRLNHQTVLGWLFYREDEEPWAAARAALLTVAAHQKALLRNRLIVTLFVWIGFAAVYPLLLAGIEGMVVDIPSEMSFWPRLFAGVFAWALKAAFLDAIAETAMLQFFLPLVREGVDPLVEAEWAETVDAGAGAE